ncbi:hypothetical protein [Streptomyces sp. NPDC046985]
MTALTERCPSAILRAPLHPARPAAARGAPAATVRARVLIDLTTWRPLII